jgi:GTP-binding protein HflX
VADASAPEDRLVAQVAAVESVLADIGAGELPIELVLNKIDAVDPLSRRRLQNTYPEAVQISARTGEGITGLKARIAERFAERFEAVRLLIPHAEGARLAELYALGAPIEERHDLAEGVLVVARLPRPDLPRYARYLVADAAGHPARVRG